MTPDLPTDPRQALEASITALLLGELPPDQAAFLERTIAADPELAKMRDRLKQTIGFLRETEATPAAQPAPQPEPVKLSPERREALLQSFKTVAPKEFAPTARQERSWLLAVAAAVLIMVFVGVFLPVLSSTKSRTSYSAAHAPSYLSLPTGGAPARDSLEELRRVQPPAGAPATSARGEARVATDGGGSVVFANRSPADQPEPASSSATLAGRTVMPAVTLNTVALPTLSQAADGRDLVVNASVNNPAWNVTASSRGFFDAPADRSSTAQGFGGGGVGASATESLGSKDNGLQATRRDLTFGLRSTFSGSPTDEEKAAQAPTTPGPPLAAGNVLSAAQGHPGIGTTAPKEAPATITGIVGGQTAPNSAFYRVSPGGAGVGGRANDSAHGDVIAGVTSAGTDAQSSDGDKRKRLGETDRSKEVAASFDLKNADPNDVAKVMDDLFHRTGQVRSSGASSPPALGTASPLTQRETQQQKSPVRGSFQEAAGAPRADGLTVSAGDTLVVVPQQLAKSEGPQFHYELNKIADSTPLYTQVPALGDTPALGREFRVSPTTSQVDVTRKLAWKNVSGKPVAGVAGGLPGAVAPAQVLQPYELNIAGFAADLGSATNTGTLGLTGQDIGGVRMAGLDQKAKQFAWKGTDTSGLLSDSIQQGQAQRELSASSGAAGNYGIALPSYSVDAGTRRVVVTREGENAKVDTLQKLDSEPRKAEAQQPTPTAGGGAVPGRASGIAPRQEPNEAPSQQAQGDRVSEGKGKLAEAERNLAELLSLKLASERTDSELPKSSVVEIVDKAEPAPTTGQTLGGRIRRALDGEVESTARIKIQRDQREISGLAGASQNTTAYDPYFVQAESEVIRSPAVLGKVVEKLRLDEAWARKKGMNGKLSPQEVTDQLNKRLELKPVKDSSLLEISVRDEQPEEAANIANAVAEVYQDLRREERQRLAVAEAKALESRRVELDKRIALAKQDIELLKAQSAPAQKTDANPPRPATPTPIPQPETQTRENSFSTFSLNVSDVSFKLAAASLEKGALPEAASIRSEEFINAFDYRDPEAPAGVPIAFAWERARYPFAQSRDLLRFSLKTAAQGRQPGRPLNLVLLLDSSGSMERADRVRIIQEALRVLATQLKPNDTFSVVTFARTARLWVDGVPGTQAAKVAEEISKLTPEGGTNLEEAMNLAYSTALRHYQAAGVNRVVVLTDGAANLGNVEPEMLKKKVETNRKQGIALDCFGIGWEGYNDDLLEVLTRNGDGRYGFINTPEEAATEFAGQLAGALHVAASDVKVQVEFNPDRVTAYRQIGYAKHQLTKEQFRDNTVDAAEIGAAESGNALYVIEVNGNGEGPLAIVRVRYKVPGTTEFHEHEWPVPYTGNAVALELAGPAIRLAAVASAFSEWLASSPYAAEVTPDSLLGLLSGVPEVYGADGRPKKLEWMLRQAKSLAGK
jgi:Mg-chelatase subunit ChlD